MMGINLRKEGSAMTVAVERQHSYQCACHHELQVFGRGRHRVYFEPEDTAFTDPVMTGTCPQCQRWLPGGHGA